MAKKLYRIHPDSPDPTKSIQLDGEKRTLKEAGRHGVNRRYTTRPSSILTLYWNMAEKLNTAMTKVELEEKPSHTRKMILFLHSNIDKLYRFLTVSRVVPVLNVSHITKNLPGKI